ncbi:DUF2950 domain-containing protein [Nordella sp. HKS 07]|uniref:DUF2950 domain-containing protein n=1 Tax=Nordella sp. HKS 07 TaxID=2712222 RepID=UPI0013E117C0|nr:DUF2950 domain-containing protein [Nordella sp. HKS 07]QIG51083.1 DUF2950 domain-containing protein [Nordella sp. HKS 07]
MYRKSLLSLLTAALLVGTASVSTVWAATKAIERFLGAEPESFKEASEAIDAFKAKMIAKDVPGLAHLIGLNEKEIGKSDDFDARLTQLQAATKERVGIEEPAPDRRVIVLGNLLWPFPFPLVKTDKGWQFDTPAGLEEILARRIGENELEAIANVRNYIEAQQEYASDDRDGDNVLEFAQKLISTEGTHDGLYWPSENGEESPAGPFVVEAKLKGAPDQGYFGYRYRILKSQGKNIAGGQYDYVINGNMIAGYALIAWPARYGETGIKTFVVNHQGTIYEKDLGPETAKLAEQITRFNPDKTWDEVDD